MDTNKSVREIDGHKFPGYRLHLTPVRHQRSPSNAKLTDAGPETMTSTETHPRRSV